MHTTRSANVRLLVERVVHCCASAVRIWPGNTRNLSEIIDKLTPTTMEPSPYTNGGAIVPTSLEPGLTDAIELVRSLDASSPNFLHMKEVLETSLVALEGLARHAGVRDRLAGVRSNTMAFQYREGLARTCVEKNRLEKRLERTEAKLQDVQRELSNAKGAGKPAAHEVPTRSAGPAIPSTGPPQSRVLPGAKRQRPDATP